MRCDNQSVIDVAYNPMEQNKMKHVKLHVHYLRQLVHEKVVSLLYCRAYDQVFYILTKSLSEEKFLIFFISRGFKKLQLWGGVNM